MMTGLLHNPGAEGETARIRAMEQHDLPPEQWDRFESVLRLARSVCGAPIASIALVGEDRVMVRAACGIEMADVGRLHSFNDMVVHGRCTLVVPDTRAHAAFANNPVVTGAAGIRFFAGAPLIDPQGHVIGALCVLDTKSRPAFDPAQQALLEDLAGLVRQRLELIQEANRSAFRVRKAALLRNLLMLTADAPDLDAALAAAAAVLRDAAGDLMCNVLRSGDDVARPVFIGSARSEDPRISSLLTALMGLKITADNSLVGRALFSGQQVVADDLACPAEMADCPGNRIMAAHGVKALIATPLSVLSNHYVFTIGFDHVPADLDGIARMLRDGALALRPLLRIRTEVEASRLFRRVVEDTTTAVIITDAVLDASGPHILYANTAFEEMSGYPLAEIVGLTPRVFQDALTSPETRAEIRTALQAGQSSNTEIQNRRKDGTAHWLHLHISPVRNLAGEVTHFFSAQRDVTEQRMVAAEREANARDMTALVGAIPGVLIRQHLRADGYWWRSFIADTVEALTGFTVAEAHDNWWWRNGTDPADWNRLRDALASAQATGPSTTEFRFRRKDKVWIWIRMLTRGHRNAAGLDEVICIWSDITRERELASQLAQSNKLAQLGELATGMAHKLNQPLAGICMAAENGLRSLARTPGVAPRAEQKLEAVLSLARRASDIIDHMRIFGRQEVSASTPVRLSDVMDGVRPLLQAQLRGSGVRLHCDVPHMLPAVMGQMIPLQQVMMNLIVNSCHAYEALSDAAPADARLITVVARVVERQVCITVGDHAGGMPPAVMSRIFEPFFTTKPAGKGTGLGLSITYGIVSDMGGTIGAECREGGTVFTIALPVAFVA